MALNNRLRWADVPGDDDVDLEPVAGTPDVTDAAEVGEDGRPRLGEDREDRRAVPEYHVNAGPGLIQQPEGLFPGFMASRVGRPVAGSGDYDSVPETALHCDIVSENGSIARNGTFDVAWVRDELRQYQGRLSKECQFFINMRNKVDAQWQETRRGLDGEQLNAAFLEYKNVKAAVNDVYVLCAGAHCFGFDSKVAFRAYVGERAAGSLLTAHKKISQGLQRCPPPQINANEVAAAMQPSKSALRRERQRLAAMTRATQAGPAPTVHEQTYFLYGGTSHLQPEYPVLANGWQEVPIAAPVMYQYVIQPDPPPVLLVPPNAWPPYAALYAQPT